MSEDKNYTNPFKGMAGWEYPDVKFNKNGYEIRADVLHLARDLVNMEMGYKWQGWEMSVERDEKTGRIATRVGMPEFPGLEAVMRTAETLYDFVQGKK